MKFLCVKCDEPMKLQKTAGPDKVGSLSVIYHCPHCSHQIAMLTNAFETQLVTSLGVKIGPGGEAVKEGSKCPFSEMLQEDELSGGPDVSMSGSQKMTSGHPDIRTSRQPQWTEEASKRLLNIPDFVRPMAKKGIEHFAVENGRGVIDDRLMDEVKEKYGM